MCCNINDREGQFCIKMGNCIPKNSVNSSDNETDISLVYRFGETADMSELFKSKSLKPSRTYYNSELMDTRMGEIRKSIIYIREHWNEYDDFLKDLREITKDVNFRKSENQEMFDSIFLSKKEWATNKPAKEVDNFSTIKLYSSDEGYNKIFSLVNRIFRQDESVDSTKLIRSMVFLVELLNIDLFNYCLSEPKLVNFTGVVYRGMALPEEDFTAFENLMEQPIADRIIAVPLSFMSTSTNINVAVNFIKREIENVTNAFPLMMKIHVIDLDPKYLDVYRTQFPSSVVSTICAVSIKEVSSHKNECEVLLRGPFFQVLQIYDSKKKRGIKKRMRILEMVMLNTNRDHISTMQLGEQSDPARILFGTMVAITRSEFAADFCRNNKLKNDEVEYRKVIEEKKSKLKELY